jgi:large subunit ribosomal protein L23
MILKRPVITEKTIANYQSDKKVTFEVDLKANKTQVKRAVESVYGVKVESCSVINRIGKYKTNRITRRAGKTADRKLMVLKLRDSDKIDVFEK